MSYTANRKKVLIFTQGINVKSVSLLGKGDTIFMSIIIIEAEVRGH